MPLKKACIFDLDGVIVDTVPAHFVSWKTITDELNIDFTEEDNEQLKGVSRVESMNRILEIGGVSLPEDQIAELITKKNDRYVSIISKMTREDILPGVMDALALLKENNIAAAIGSSSKNATRILEAIGLTKEFDVIVDGNHIKNSKPDPEVFLQAAEKLGLDAKLCTVVEDASAGVEAAKKGGMHCIGIGEKDILGEADVVIPSMKEFTLLLLTHS
ncbi:MAG: beta-phosphoglucomutase [Ekhidna sp.]|nr:beta-phosphoglucomutase [Ekhidna sp.]